MASLVAGLERPGLIATNPPWGGRMLDQKKAGVLLKEAVEVWRRVMPGWRLAVLTPDAASVEALQMKKPRLVPLESGALEVMLAVGEL
jgi:23S rRNA G2445 N2-methylase RlmL